MGAGVIERAVINRFPACCNPSSPVISMAMCISDSRLQSTADNHLRAYVAQGEVLPVATRSFGGVGIFAIPEMGRFYRHVLIEKNFPHHGAVAFGHYGKALFEIFKYLDVEEVGFTQPKGMLYPSENPFA